MNHLFFTQEQLQFLYYLVKEELKSYEESCIPEDLSDQGEYMINLCKDLLMNLHTYID